MRRVHVRAAVPEPRLCAQVYSSYKFKNKTTFTPAMPKTVGNYCCFILSRRRQYRADGPAFLKEHGGRGESASRAEPYESPQHRELEVIRGGIALPNSRVAYQSRSPVFRTLSRSSSGYFSFDSEPSSPLITHSTATQTPSPSSQVITHALQRISKARGDAQNHGKDPSHISPRVLGLHADITVLSTLCTVCF